jgi:type IV pilus assembly protein PilC
MAVVITSVLAMVMIFVIPKYETIFKDFGLKLPAVTQLTLDVARVFGPIILAAVSAAVLIWTGLSLWQMFHPQRLGVLVGRGVRDRIVWATPVAHGIARDRGLADAFDLISGAVRSGLPIERALDEAAQLNINSVLRERFERWSQGMAGGATLADAARAAPMPPLVTGMLVGVRGTEAAGEVFAFLARYYHTRYSRTAALAAGAAVPVTVFFFAALVTVVALSLFTPIISLINNLSSSITRI